MSKIRLIALGLIKTETHVFLSKGFDPHSQSIFYRALGGGVKFQETSKNALKREFWEEIEAKLTQIKYLGCLENIFVFNNEPKHEIIQLYQCDFVDTRFYEHRETTIKEKNRQKIAQWVTIEDCIAKKILVYPSLFLQYL